MFPYDYGDRFINRIAQPQFAIPRGFGGVKIVTLSLNYLAKVTSCENHMTLGKDGLESMNTNKFQHTSIVMMALPVFSSSDISVPAQHGRKV